MDVWSAATWWQSALAELGWGGLRRSGGGIGGTRCHRSSDALVVGSLIRLAQLFCGILPAHVHNNTNHLMGCTISFVPWHRGLPFILYIATVCIHLFHCESLHLILYIAKVCKFHLVHCDAYASDIRALIGSMGGGRCIHVHVNCAHSHQVGHVRNFFLFNGTRCHDAARWMRL